MNISTYFKETIQDTAVQQVDMVRKDNGRYILYLNKVFSRPLLLDVETMTVNNMKEDKND